MAIGLVKLGASAHAWVNGAPVTATVTAAGVGVALGIVLGVSVGAIAGKVITIEDEKASARTRSTTSPRALTAIAKRGPRSG